MSEALSEELSLVMWYTARLAFLVYFMVSQSWKLTLLSCMGLPIIWVVAKVFGKISQVKFTDNYPKISRLLNPVTLLASRMLAKNSGRCLQQMVQDHYTAYFATMWLT